MLQAHGIAGGDPCHLRLHAISGIQRIGIGLQEYTHQRRCFAVDATDELIVLRTQFHASHVFQSEQRAIRIGAHNNVFKFAGLTQATAGGNAVHQFLRATGGCLTDFACSELRILLIDGADDVVGRYLQLRHPVRPHPDAHGVIFRTENLYVGRAGDALERIQHVQRDVIRNEQIIATAIRRGERHHLQK